jgi:hypothetical protein
VPCDLGLIRIYILFKILCNEECVSEARHRVVVKALSYKQEGRGFET